MKVGIWGGRREKGGEVKWEGKGGEEEEDKKKKSEGERKKEEPEWDPERNTLREHGKYHPYKGWIKKG